METILEKLNRLGIGTHIVEAIQAFKKKRVQEVQESKYKVEFRMCGHPELVPTQWNQSKPEPCRTVGTCPIHNYSCPVCGFGVGTIPHCGCPEERI